MHDFLYSGGLEVTRAQADAVFREALAASGYGWVVRNIMFAGVRAGGAGRFLEPGVQQPLHVEAQMEAP